MKTATRALTPILSLGLLLGLAGEARAGIKQECAAAYDQTQALREEHKLLAARKQALFCSASVCSAFITKDCAQWLAEIEASLPSVVFAAQDTTGADTASVRVALDGKLVADRLDGTAVSLDPGEHVVRFEISGSAAIEQKLLIRQGEKNRTVSVVFKPTPAPVAAAPVAPPIGPVVHVSDFAPSDSARGVPAWAWITGGAGLALVGVGAVFGVSALSAQSSLKEACGGDPANCTVQNTPTTVNAAKDLASKRDLDRNVFIGLAAAGVVGIGVAVVGIARAPSKRTSETGLIVVPFGSPSGGGFAMSGLF